MDVFNPVNSIRLTCCPEPEWYHKICLKKSAFSFADDFDCPKCGNRDEFRLNMQMNGVYIPNGSYLPHYVSQIEEIEDPVPKSKRRRVHTNYILVETFKNKKEAMEALAKMDGWSYYYSNNSSSGLRITYRCTAMKFRGKQCGASMVLLYDSKSSDVYLYRSESDHTHDDEECKKNAVDKMTPEVEAAIRELFSQKMKPKAILYNLVVKGFSAPPKSRLTTFLTKLRHEEFGYERLNFGSLQKWLEESSDVPTVDTEPFIVNYDVNIDDEVDENCSFRFLVSSKALIHNIIDLKKLHTDATYKLIWQGFPVLVVGQTDNNKKFHPAGMVVSTHEKTEDFEFMFRSLASALSEIFGKDLKPRILISDAAFAIINAFKNVFGLDEHVMCWAHMRRNTSKRANLIKDKKKRCEFMADIDKLQLSRSTQIFEKAAQLFVNKWRAVSSDIVEYIEDEWLKQHPTWYEGYARNTPSTNNALESFNRS